MRSSELMALVRRFPGAVGALLVTPGAALREIAAAEKGGFGVLVGWCLVAAVSLRFVILVGRDPPHRFTQALYVVAGAWAVALAILAVRIAARRPLSGRGAEPSPAARRAKLAAGVSALAILALGLGGGVVWTVRNASRL